jgi:hypothetical protein
MVVEASTRADCHAAVASRKMFNLCLFGVDCFKGLSACVNRLGRASRCLYAFQCLSARGNMHFGRYGRESQNERCRHGLSCLIRRGELLTEGLPNEEGSPRWNLWSSSKVWNHFRRGEQARTLPARCLLLDYARRLASCTQMVLVAFLTPHTALLLL